MERKVDYEINILRTFAIILVVLLHVNAPNIMAILKNGGGEGLTSIIVIFISVITRIGVPLFVMISGRYVLASLKDTSIKDFYKKRIPRLVLAIIPAIIFYGLVCIIGYPNSSLMQFIKDIFTGFAFNGACVHLWYMYMLLGLYLVAPFIYKFIKDKSLKASLVIGIVLCIVGMGTEIVKNIFDLSVWPLWWVEFLGLFILGYVLKDIKIKSKRGIFLAVAIIVEVISTIGSCILLLKGNELGMVFHFGVVPNAQITTIMVYLFANSFIGKDNVFSRVSKYTLGIYLYHQVLAITLVRTIRTGVVVVDIFIGTAVAYCIPLIIMAILYKKKSIRRFIS